MMRFTLIRLFTCILCCAFLGLAACGESGQSGSGDRSMPDENPSSTPGNMVSPASTTSPTPTRSGTSPQVEIKLQKTAFGVKDAIVVFIANRSARNIFARTQASSCSIIQLERQVQGAWQIQRLCSPLREPTIIEIAASTTKIVTLQPRSVGGKSTYDGPWSPGMYRVLFSYQMQRDPDTVGGGERVFSPSFSIGQ